MSWTSGIVVFVITWWTVLFAVLPFGNAPPKDLPPGHFGGAPDKPRMWRKALVTTAITSVIWLCIHITISLEILSFRP